MLLGCDCKRETEIHAKIQEYIQEQRDGKEKRLQTRKPKSRHSHRERKKRNNKMENSEGVGRGIGRKAN